MPFTIGCPCTSGGTGSRCRTGITPAPERQIEHRADRMAGKPETGLAMPGATYGETAEIQRHAEPLDEHERGQQAA